jgi:transcriptional regulator with XRE-family HTH domain
MKRIPSSLSGAELELAKLGENIRRVRRSLKVSQEEFADMCTLHRTYVCDIERGARNVSFSSLLKLARGSRTTISELTRGVESEDMPNGKAQETGIALWPKPNSADALNRQSA